MAKPCRACIRHHTPPPRPFRAWLQAGDWYHARKHDGQKANLENTLLSYEQLFCLYRGNRPGLTGTRCAGCAAAAPDRAAAAVPRVGSCSSRTPLLPVQPLPRHRSSGPPRPGTAIPPGLPRPRRRPPHATTARRAYNPPCAYRMPWSCAGNSPTSLSSAAGLWRFPRVRNVGEQSYVRRIVRNPF